MARDLKEQITDILLSALQPALEKLDPESQKSTVSPSSALRRPPEKSVHVSPSPASRRPSETKCPTRPSDSNVKHLDSCSGSLTSATELNRIFCGSGKLGKRPKIQKGGHVKKAKSWKHIFVCLSDPDDNTLPDANTRSQLLLAGLGERELCMSWYGDSDEVYDVIMKTYSNLSEGGGYELLRQVCGCTMEIIPLPPEGYTVQYLKSTVQNAKIYIRPIQRQLDLSVLECDVSYVACLLVCLSPYC